MSSIASLMLTTLVFLTIKHRVVQASACDGGVQRVYAEYSRNDSIFSPGYPRSYYDSQSCQWRIIASSGHRILIYFTVFDLESCESCNCDKVEIYDGQNQYYNILSKSCGNSLPDPVYSTGTDIFMKFTSDSMVSRRGFVAYYRVLNDSSGCPSIIPGASAGVIYSPNFPWSYPLSRSCEWRIRAPWGQRVHLKFIKFNLETSSFSCEFDYVEVLDKYNTQLGKYCGSDIPSSISSSSSLTVKFNSDYSNAFSGFLLLYQTGYSFPTGAPVWTTYRPYTSTTVQYHSCSSYSSETSVYVESTSSTSIRSDYDDYLKTRAPYSSCTFKISTKKGYNLKFSLETMYMPGCYSCSCGYLKVRDGSSSSDPLLGEYCGSVSSGTVTSTGNHLFVVFNSDYSSARFRATVSSIKGSNVKVAAIVVPIVIAVVLFSVIFVVIKCTKINRSAGPAGSSRVNDVRLQPLSDTMVVQTIAPSLSPGTLQVDVPPPHSIPLTAPVQLPPSTDHSQGFTNFTVEGEYVQG